MNGGAPLGRTKSAFIFASSAAFASYPGIEAPNSSSVPRLKFIVRVISLILAGIFSSRSISCPDSGLFVGRTVPTMYSFWVSGITVLLSIYSQSKIGDYVLILRRAARPRQVFHLDFV